MHPADHAHEEAAKRLELAQQGWRAPPRRLFRYVDRVGHEALRRHGCVRLHPPAYFRDTERLGSEIGDDDEGITMMRNRPGTYGPGGEWPETYRRVFPGVERANIIFEGVDVQVPNVVEPAYVFCLSDTLDRQTQLALGVDESGTPQRTKAFCLDYPLTLYWELHQLLRRAGAIREGGRIFPCRYVDRLFFEDEPEAMANPAMFKPKSHADQHEWRFLFYADGRQREFIDVKSKKLRSLIREVSIPVI